MTTPAPRDGGFTLVEALVSLLVFSLIAAGCMTMLMQSVASQKTVTESQGALRELQTARALLSADALQIVLRATREADGTRALAFVGGQSPEVALHLVRGSADAVSGGATMGRLQVVDYRFVDGALLRRSRDFLDPVGDEGVSERRLFAAIENGRFEFFDGAEWRETWAVSGAGGSLPRALALVGEIPRYGAVRIEVLVEPSS